MSYKNTSPKVRGKSYLKLNYLSLILVFPFVKWKWKSLSRVELFVTPWTIQWNSPGQNTGVGSRSLLQGIVPTQGSNPGLPHCRQILYQLSHQGSPRILEWVAYPLLQGDLPSPGIKPGSPELQADSLPAELPGEPLFLHTFLYFLMFI